jgi:hypothetical protein
VKYTRIPSFVASLTRLSKRSQLRRVRARVGGLEALALRAGAVAQLGVLDARDLAVGQGGALADDAPQHGRADGVGAHGAHRHEGARLRDVVAVQQLIVVHHQRRLIRRCLRRGGAEGGEDDGDQRDVAKTHRGETVVGCASPRHRDPPPTASAMPHARLP